jgi:hypothetical protein
LRTQPKGFSNALTFGQYICDKIDVNNTLLTLYATTNCNSENSNRIENQTFYANLDFKQYLNCKNGIFESNHSLNPIQTYFESTQIGEYASREKTLLLSHINSYN